MHKHEFSIQYNTTGLKQNYYIINNFGDDIIWAIHNCEGKFSYDSYNWYFELEEDAINFKLTFA